MTQFSISMLDKSTQDALHLSWVSCKDFNALSNEDNKERLKNVWASMKVQFFPFFKEQEITFTDIATDLKDFVLSIEPTLGFAYSPEMNILEANLWTLLFGINLDMVIPPVPWKLAGMLVHEHDHYLFLSSAGMIGADEKSSDEFQKANWISAEVRAYNSELKFLKKCRENLSPFFLQQFRITGWTPNGQPFPTSIYKWNIYPKTDCLVQLDREIDFLNKLINRIKKADEYYKISEDHYKSENRKRARLLSLPINLDRLSKPYPQIRLEL